MEDTFLSKIAANPRSNETRLIYADWLEENGDPRSEYLRCQVSIASDPLMRNGTSAAVSDATEALMTRANSLRLGLNSQWMDAVDIHFDFIIFSFGRFKLNAVKNVLTITGLSLLESKRLVERCPAVVHEDVPLNRALELIHSVDSDFGIHDVLEDLPAFALKMAGTELTTG